jgi:hypothetical protein
MSDVGVLPPATGIWYDVDDTLAAVLHILRLQGGDIDADYIRNLIPAAGMAIDAYVDSETVVVGPPPAGDYQYAIEQYTIDLYRADVPPAVGQYMPPDGSYLRSRLKSLIGHRRARQGVA